jgi:ABC-type Fe3+ transport system permease subunit
MNYINIFGILIYFIFLVFLGGYVWNDNNNYDINIISKTDINLIQVLARIIIPLSLLLTFIAGVMYLPYNYYDDKIKNGDNTLENQKIRDNCHIAFITLICFATIPFLLMIFILFIMYLKYKASKQKS